MHWNRGYCERLNSSSFLTFESRMQNGSVPSPQHQLSRLSNKLNSRKSSVLLQLLEMLPGWNNLIFSRHYIRAASLPFGLKRNHLDPLLQIDKFYSVVRKKNSELTFRTVVLQWCECPSWSTIFFTQRTAAFSTLLLQVFSCSWIVERKHDSLTIP